MTKPKRNFNKNPRPTEKTLQDTVSSLVLEQVKKITANYIAGEISTGAKNGKRTLSEEGSDSDDSPETPSTKRRRNGKRSSEAPVFAAAPTLATASASSSSASSSTTAGATPPVTEISHPISYKSQVVILEGAWSRDCPKYKEAVEKKSFSSVTKATVADGFAHDMVKNMVMAVVAEIKKQIAVIIAEVTSKALLEHVFYEIESKRTQGQKSLSTNDRISSIVKMTTQAVNKAPFAQYDESQISNDDIHGEVMGRLKDSLSCNNQKAKSSSTQS